MANLLDYLDWRGDLTLAQSPFSEVDNLILAELSFVDFTGIVPAPGSGAGIPLYQAANAFFTRFPAGEKIDMGVLVPNAIPKMLQKMASTARFRDMRLSCFTTHLDVEKSEQFAALAIECGDGAVYFSFRGTDDTLAGWKEDFHLTCMPEIPAQKLARDYVVTAAKQFPRKKLRLGGHSKGGNLAVWASVFAPAALQRRIESVWSNDGPGFHDNILSLPAHQRISDRIFCIVPKTSVVGMLLEHEEDYIVVDSDQQGLLQHDGFSWQVLGDHFVRLCCVTRQSRLYDRVLREWVDQLSLAQRERFVDGLFEVLEASGAVTLTDLQEDRFKASVAMIKAMKDMDKETRDTLTYAMKLLFLSNLQIRFSDWQQEAEKKTATLKQSVEEKARELQQEVEKKASALKKSTPKKKKSE